MLHPENLHDYQVRAVNHMLMQPQSMLWLGTGLGKSVVTLSAASHLIKHGAVRSTLILGPLRVVQSVWRQEAMKWSHTRHLKFSLIHGTPEQRLRALFTPADVYLLNYEGIPWLIEMMYHYFVAKGTLLPFDMLVADEVPKLKNPETKRMEALIPYLRYFNYRTGLTGTPASNGLEDLFGQYLVIDSGARFGRIRDDYLARFFRRGGFNGYKWTATAEGEAYIHRVVADITLQMNTRDYIDLPELIINDIYVDLKPKHRRQYEELEALFFTELDNGVQLEIDHPNAKVNKCWQFSNGTVYTNTETKEWHKVHDEKLEALQEIVDEAQGEPILVAYKYRPDAYRIQEKFPWAVNLSGLSGTKFNQALSDWKEGKLRMLLGHPASMAHGVDGLQDRGHILVWFGLNPSLELTIQFNDRLSRQGQGHPVMCHRILTKDTLDDATKMSLIEKDGVQRDLTDAVQEYRRLKGV